MLTDPITVGFTAGETTADKYRTRNYHQISCNGNSSVYSDPTRDPDEPRTIFISHENNKSGTKQNSVMVLRTIVEDANNPGVYGQLDVQIKVSFDIAVFDKDDVEKELAFAGFLLLTGDTGECLVYDDTVTFNLDGPPADFLSKFLNKEH